MSTWVSNGKKWCKLAVEQPSKEEIAERLDRRFRHPLQQGLRLMHCGSLVAGQAHKEPLDDRPRCNGCAKG